jgi:hypothetical protein
MLIGVLPAWFGTSFLTLAIVSSSLRWLTWVGLMPRLREVRHMQHVPAWDIVFGVLRLQPAPVISRVIARLLLRRADAGQ